jgi:hypothetical protein
MPEDTAIRWLTAFLDFPADSFDAGVAFWRSVTGYGLSAPRGETGQFATLLPSAGDAYLRVQRIDSGAGGCHLDLHVDMSAATLDAVAARATALGASQRYREQGELIILDSPAGFTFCLVRWEGEAEVPPVATGDPGGDAWARVYTLCLDVPPDGFSAECAFWSELTGWEQRQVPVPGYTALRRPPGMPFRLLLQRLDSAAPGRRAGGHLDLDIGSQNRAGIAARHVAAGARITRVFPHWTALADPAEREYCLVRTAG